MIQLAYPLALAALAAIPVILVLYLLRPRPRRLVVPTTELWRAALRDRERGLGLRKLLRDASLLLLLASAATLALALAGPQWLAATRERPDTVLVLDTSASMQTRSGLGRTRFDQALAEAGAIVDGLPRGGRMLVMTSGHKAALKSGFETDPGALRRMLSQLRPGDEAGRPREALALAQSLLRGRERGRIYFITDGGFDAGVDPGSPLVEYRIVGAPARNVGITRFDVRRERASDERFQVLLTVRNFGDAPALVPASATLDGRPLFSRSLELAAGAQQTLVLAFDGRAAGRALARLDVDDDLAADNQAFAVLDAGESMRVLLFSAGNFYLESALEALPGVNLVKRKWSGEDDLAQLARAHDVVVLDGVDAPRLPAGNFLLIDTVAPELPFAHAGRVAQPQISGRAPSPLMRDVDLTAVRIAAARRLSIAGEPAGLTRLFWSAETPLGLALIDADVKLVYLGFELAQSNFPLQVAFPLFISHSLEWLRPRSEAFASTHSAAGVAVPIRLPAGAAEAIVRTPSGRELTLPAQDGTALFDATAEAGFYRYAAGESVRDFAVSLTDARESDVNDRWQPAARAEAADAAGDSIQALLPLWPYLLALAAALLALEWGAWTWSRRSA